jgi:hypothetical protein
VQLFVIHLINNIDVDDISLDVIQATVGGLILTHAYLVGLDQRTRHLA